VYFYDFEFNLLLYEASVLNWKFTKYYNGIGTFCAHLPISSKVIKVVSENDYLVCRFGNEYAIITGKEIADELIIYGRTLNWLLSKRVVLPYSDKSCNTGEFVQWVFGNTYNDCEVMTLGEIRDGETRSYASDVPKPLSVTVFDALKADNLGNELLYDKEGKVFILNILSGTDKNLIISEANKNASGTRITENVSETSNLCYYETENGYEFVGGDKSGIYRYETYVLSEKKSDAEERLAGTIKESTVTVNTTGIVYKKDYNLGDIVSVQLIKGDLRTTKRLRIAGVELSNSSKNGYVEKPLFEEIK